MRTKKLSVTFIVTALVLVSFTVNVSQKAEAIDFMEIVPNNGLSSDFTPYDVKWDHTGTMAVVVGQDSLGGPNAYAYFPANETWVPLIS